MKGVDRPLLEKMKAAGCQRIQFGVEQGTEEGLLRLKKDVTSLEIESAFRLCREVGINTVAYFMIGTPVERTKQDVEDTIRYSIKLDPDFVMFNLMTPFPGTTLFDEGLRDGVLDLDPGRSSCEARMSPSRLRSGTSTSRARSSVTCSRVHIESSTGDPSSSFGTSPRSATLRTSSARPLLAYDSLRAKDDHERRRTQL